MTQPLRAYLDFAIETAYLAGRLTLAHFQTGVQADYKADDSPVTVADRLSEQLIRSRIEKCYPQHAILGEEYGLQGSENATHRWIIDPIDGTKSFLRGVPLYAVLIALEIEGKAEVGAVYLPALGEMIAAATHEGCWWNGRRCAVTSNADLSRAIVSCTSPTSFAAYGRQAAWERIQKATYYHTGWGDAYGYCLVATGRLELMLDPVMNVWDAGPFLPVLQEAGGYFGDWQGNATIYGGEGLATTRSLLPGVMELIRG